MPDELDSFLKEGTRPEGAPPAAEAPAEKAGPETAPAESKAPEAAPEAAAKASETKAEPEDEEVAPHAGSDNRTVPFSALEKVRNDWKSKYAAEQARAELLAKQLEEAKRPSPPPSAPPQQGNVVTLPDFNTDPRGFVVGMAIQHQRELVNERLNISQALLTDKIGEAKVQEYVNDFKAFAEQDPTLWPKLYQQAMPYQWMTSEIDRRRMHREIGDDPSAFEARIREKVLAEIAAGGNGNGEAAPAPRGPGLPAQPPSLAAARSVAGRTTSTFTGPPPMTELFPGVENRRRAR